MFKYFISFDGRLELWFMVAGSCLDYYRPWGTAGDENKQRSLKSIRKESWITILIIMKIDWNVSFLILHRWIPYSEVRTEPKKWPFSKNIFIIRFLLKYYHWDLKRPSLPLSHLSRPPYDRTLSLYHLRIHRFLANWWEQLITDWSACWGQNSFLAEMNRPRDQRSCSLKAETRYSWTRFKRIFLTKDVRRKSRDHG